MQEVLYYAGPLLHRSITDSRIPHYKCASTVTTAREKLMFKSQGSN